jgi:hypothetical protein
MSEWIKTKTQFRLEYAQCLVKALEARNPDWVGHIELYPEGAEMLDYHRKTLRANVIVRRQYAGGFGDLGFVAQADGSLMLVADDGHRNVHGYGRGRVTGDWLAELTQEYAGKIVEQQAEELGLDVEKSVEQLPDGKARWRYELGKAGAKMIVADNERLW